MTVTFDASLGSNHANKAAGVGTLVITTGAPASAGSRIVVLVSWDDFTAGTGVFTVSDGTAYTQDTLFSHSNDHISVFSRVLVGSLASASSITVSWTSTFHGGGVLAGACSYLGTSSVDTTASASGAGTSFSSGSATNTVGDSLFVGGAGNDASATTVGGTNTNGTPRFDIFDATALQGIRMLDKISTTIGAQALAGTWASSTINTYGALVIYKGGGGSTFIAPPSPRLDQAPKRASFY